MAHEVKVTMSEARYGTTLARLLEWAELHGVKPEEVRVEDDCDNNQLDIFFHRPPTKAEKAEQAAKAKADKARWEELERKQLENLLMKYGK